MADSGFEDSQVAEDAVISSPTDRRDSVLVPIPAFRHAPLQDIAKQIRVCDIHAASDDDAVVVFHLRTIPLSSTGGWTCVSYVWGTWSDGLKPVIVSADGQLYAVTPNLHALLRRLRGLGVQKDLWIDAVCIDQQDKAEKAQQVKMMGQIYTGAKEVLVALDTSVPAIPEGPDLARAALEGLASDQHLRELVCFSDRIAGDALRKLLTSTWFTRAWTVQEIVLSREAKALYPGGLLPWSVLQQALSNWHMHRAGCCSSLVESIDQALHNACYDAYNALEIITRTKERLPNGHHLFTALMEFVRMDVTDERDMAFAFHGLHTAPSRLPDPDYEKKTPEVFTELVAWLLEEWGSLLPLCLEMRGTLDIPSWVPCFCSKAPFDANFWRTRLSCFDRYNCAKHLRWSFDCVGRKLKLPGIRIDEVRDFSRAAHEFESWETRAALLRDWLDFYREDGASSDARVDAVFANTLIAGCTADENGERRAHEGDIYEWRLFLQTLIQDQTLRDEDYPSSLMHCHLAAVFNRRLFRTVGGKLGVGPECLESNDSIWMLSGGKVPFVLRPSASSSSPGTQYSLIGPAYLHSAMDGQAYSPQVTVERCCLV